MDYIIDIINEEVVEEESTCRYCLSDISRENMIAPCNCTGTVKYVHKECLKDWNSTRNPEIISFDGEIYYYRYKCELCKSYYRYDIGMSDKNFAIFMLGITGLVFIVCNGLI